MNPGGRNFSENGFFLLTILFLNQEVQLKLGSIKTWETFVRAMSRASVID